MLKKWGPLFLMIMILFSCSGKTDGTGTTVVRAWHFPDIVHASAIVGKSMGVFEKSLGKNVEVKWYVFNAGPTAIEALFSGAVDIGYIGPNPAINGYIRSKGEALRIIAGSSSGGAGLVVRKGSGIREAGDFAGKKIATPQIGNTQDVACRAWLKSNGLEIREKGGTVTVLPLRNPDQLTLFLKGEIDGAWTKEPWVSRLINEGNGEMFLDEREIWPDGKFVTSHLIVRTAFLKQWPDLVKKWVEAHVETIAWINSHAEESKQILGKAIGEITGKPLPRIIIDSAMNRTLITWDPVKSSLIKSAEDAFRLGFLGDQPPDLSFIYDLKILNEVLTAKGLEKIK